MVDEQQQQQQQRVLIDEDIGRAVLLGMPQAKGDAEETISQALADSLAEAELYRLGWQALCALPGLVTLPDLPDLLAALPARLRAEARLLVPRAAPMAPMLIAEEPATGTPPVLAAAQPMHEAASPAPGPAPVQQKGLASASASAEAMAADGIVDKARPPTAPQPTVAGLDQVVRETAVDEGAAGRGNIPNAGGGGGTATAQAPAAASEGAASKRRRGQSRARQQDGDDRGVSSGQGRRGSKPRAAASATEQRPVPKATRAPGDAAPGGRAAKAPVRRRAR